MRSGITGAMLLASMVRGDSSSGAAGLEVALELVGRDGFEVDRGPLARIDAAFGLAGTGAFPCREAAVCNHRQAERMTRRGGASQVARAGAGRRSGQANTPLL